MNGELTHASLFAGIGGIDEAAHRAGLRTLWGCEIDEACQRVLRHHFPTVPWMGDVEDVMDVIDGLRSPDVVSAGSPCQGLSMAGRQEGLEDERSGLFIRFADILSMTDARFGVWENVPGALTSNGGEDFATVLEMLLEVEPGTIGVLPKAKTGRRGRFAGFAVVSGGRSLAWRVLDAQHLGLPQRRERIVLVVDKLGTMAPAESLGIDISHEREVIPDPSIIKLNGGGFIRLCDDWTDKGAEFGITRPDLVDLLEDDPGEEWYLSAKAASGILRRTRRRVEKHGEYKRLPAVLEVALMVTAGEEVDDTLAKEVILEIERRGLPEGAIPHVEPIGTICTTMHGRYYSNYQEVSQGSIVATFRKSKRARSATDDTISNTLNTFDIGGIRDTNLAVELPELRVRRLTPLEAERLMGLDDNWTLVPGSTNTTRFKQVGNSVAVPVFRYVFERLRTVTEGST